MHFLVSLLSTFFLLHTVAFGQSTATASPRVESFTVPAPSFKLVPITAETSDAQPTPAPHQTRTPVQPPYPGAVPATYSPGTKPFRSIYAAAQTYRREGYARVVPLDDGTEIYPYGKRIPTVSVPILHFSTLELAPNEYATNRSVGDGERWSVETGTKGEKGNFTQLIYVKPRECGPLRTNLTIATNQGRTYELTLVALACDPKGAPRLEGWTRKVSWYYPDGTVPARSEMQRAMQVPAVAQGGGPAPLGYPAPQVNSASYTPPSPSPFEPPAAPYQESPAPIRGPEPRSTAAVDLRRLNTSNYEIDVDRRFPCSPEHVGDDGERTQVRLGVGPECAVTFPLYRVNEDRTLELVNYEVFNGNTYVVEGVFEKTALLYMDAKGRQHRATFTNTSLSSKRSRSRR